MTVSASLWTERNAVVGLLSPVAATTARTSVTILPKNFGDGVVMVGVGDASASSLVTLIKAADASAGSSASIATAALGGTATTDDNVVKLFNIMESDMFDSVRPYFGVTIAAGVALGWAVVIFAGPKYASPTQGDGQLPATQAVSVVR